VLSSKEKAEQERLDAQQKEAAFLRKKIEERNRIAMKIVEDQRLRRIRMEQEELQRIAAVKKAEEDARIEAAQVFTLDVNE
jgi:hypothetical protein